MSWENRRGKEDADLISAPAPVRKCITAIVLVGFLSPLAAQDRLTKALDKYQGETDPVRKARALAKLAQPQIDFARKQLDAGDDVASLNTLEKYRDEVQETFAALKATGIDAERKPAGFKELQISIRRSLRSIDDLIFSLPVDKRPFFRAVRADLAKVQNELIDVLFPRRPSRNPKNNP
jgi:hypothetical protein